MADERAHPMVEEPRKRPPQELVMALWRRRKWLALLAFVAPLAAGLSLTAALPNVYQSAAIVMAEGQQVPEFFVRSTVTSAVETRLQTISQEVLSRARLEALINRFGLYADLRERAPIESAVARMRSDIRLNVKSTELRGLREASVAFTISYQGSNPQT